MVCGKVDEFSVKKDGKNVSIKFRYPSMKDVPSALSYINAVRKEAEFLGLTHMETTESEKKYLQEQIENIEKRKGVFLFVEVENKIVGSSVIKPNSKDVSHHVGTFGISLREEFTGLGIGTRLARKVLELAKTETRFTLIESEHFSENKRSKALHEKLGFKQWGVFPNERKLKTGRLNDGVHLYLEL